MRDHRSFIIDFFFSPPLLLGLYQAACSTSLVYCLSILITALFSWYVNVFIYCVWGIDCVYILLLGFTTAKVLLQLGTIFSCYD